jgi:hypothetical protein
MISCICSLSTDYKNPLIDSKNYYHHLLPRENEPYECLSTSSGEDLVLLETRYRTARHVGSKYKSPYPFTLQGSEEETVLFRIKEIMLSELASPTDNENFNTFTADLLEESKKYGLYDKLSKFKLNGEKEDPDLVFEFTYDLAKAYYEAKDSKVQKKHDPFPGAPLPHFTSEEVDAVYEQGRFFRKCTALDRIVNRRLLAAALSHKKEQPFEWSELEADLNAKRYSIPQYPVSRRSGLRISTAPVEASI